MKPSTIYFGLTLALGLLMAGLFFEVGPETLFRDHGIAFLTMMISGATASILREMGR